MPFLKHQYVFYHEDELREGSLFHHTEACSLTEIQTYVPMRGNFRPPPPKTYNYCILHQGMYAFPKGYATDCMGWDGKDLRVTDGMRWNPDLRFMASLRHDLRQDEAVEKTYKALEANGHKGCTLSLPCGYGKTVCALALASALRRKTFVLVHTVFLAKQWEDRIKQFIPGAGVHKVRGAADFDEDKGCEFGIGLMQTVKNMSSSMFSNYGFLIIDEAHHLPCQTLQSCLPKFNSRYTLALSATPERIDGLTNFIYWSIGRSAFLIRPSYPNVQVLKAEYERPFCGWRPFAQFRKSDLHRSRKRRTDCKDHRTVFGRPAAQDLGPYTSEATRPKLSNGHHAASAKPRRGERQGGAHARRGQGGSRGTPGRILRDRSDVPACPGRVRLPGAKHPGAGHAEGRSRAEHRTNHPRRG